MKIGISQIKNTTPSWATWVFRIVFILTTATTFVIAGEPTIPDEMKARIMVYLKGIDMVIYGLSKMIGVDVKNEETTITEEK